jgi:hypothetical protein
MNTSEKGSCWALASVTLGVLGVGCGTHAADEASAIELSEDLLYAVQMTHDGFYLAEERMTKAAREEMLQADLEFAAQYGEGPTLTEEDLPVREVISNVAERFYRTVPLDATGPIDGVSGLTRQELLAVSCGTVAQNFSSYFKIYTGTSFTGSVACFIKRDAADYHFNIPSSWALHPNWSGIHSLIIVDRQSPGIWSRNVATDSHNNGHYGTASWSNLGTTWLRDGLHDFDVACG